MILYNMFMDQDDNSNQKDEYIADGKRDHMITGRLSFYPSWRGRRRRVDDQGSDSFQSSQLLSLSLFLMLLAFFIVLNSLSDFKEQKVKPAMISVERVFSTEQAQRLGSIGPIVEEKEVVSLYRGPVLDRLKVLFAAQIPGYQVIEETKKGVMHVTVPYEAFKEAVSVAQQPDLLAYPEQLDVLENFFAPTLSSLIETERGGVSYRMNIFYNTNINPAENIELARESVANIAAIAQKIMEAGLPPHFITVGVKQGDTKVLDIYFYPQKRGA